MILYYSRQTQILHFTYTGSPAKLDWYTVLILVHTDAYEYVYVECTVLVDLWKDVLHVQ